MHGYSKTRGFIHVVMLLAGMASTSVAEHDLGTWAGADNRMAWLIPLVCDLYLIYTTIWRRKDMGWSVSLVLALNIWSHFVASSQGAAQTITTIALAIIPPIILWRLHSEHVEIAPEQEVVEIVKEVEVVKEVEIIKEVPKPVFISNILPANVVTFPELDAPAEEETGGPVVTVPDGTTYEQVAWCTYRGYSVAEVAKILDISARTVYRHVKAYKQAVLAEESPCVSA